MFLPSYGLPEGHDSMARLQRHAPPCLSRVLQCWGVVLAPLFGLQEQWPSPCISGPQSGRVGFAQSGRVSLAQGRHHTANLLIPVMSVREGGTRRMVVSSRDSCENSPHRGISSESARGEALPGLWECIPAHANYARHCCFTMNNRSRVGGSSKTS